MGGGVLVEALAGCGGKREFEVGAAVDVGGGLGVAEVLAFDLGRALEQPDLIRCGAGPLAVEELIVGGEAGWLGGERGGIVGVGASIDSVDGELGALADGLFNLVGVAFAGDFDEDLVVAEAVLLHRGFGHAEAVDAVGDDLDGLVEGAVVGCLDGGGGHGHAQRAVRAGGDGIAGVGVGGKKAADLRGLGGGDTRDNDGVGIGGVGFAHRGAWGRGGNRNLERGGVAVAFSGERLLYLDGEHEVGAALEVEAEVDAVGEGLLEGIAETLAGGVRDADDAIREEEQDGDDDGGLGAEILAHDVLRGAAGARSLPCGRPAEVAGGG